MLASIVVLVTASHSDAAQAAFVEPDGPERSHQRAADHIWHEGMLEGISKYEKFQQQVPAEGLFGYCYNVCSVCFGRHRVKSAFWGEKGSLLTERLSFAGLYVSRRCSSVTATFYTRR